MCQQRGLTCTPKTWGPKREKNSSQRNFSTSAATSIPPKPISLDSEKLDDCDLQYLGVFHRFTFPSPYRPLLSFTSGLGVERGCIEFYNITDINCFQSTLYRSAVLVLMSHLQNSESSDTVRYLAKYNREARKCLGDGSYEELVYSSYVIAIYSIIGGESIHMAINHCRQFCGFLVQLSRTQKRMDDWVELLWRDLLACLYYVHRDVVVFKKSLECVAQWQELLETSYSLLVSEDDISNLPLSMTTEKICHKINSLSVYMQIYLDQFLIRVNAAENAEATKITRIRLYSILDRIVQLVARLPHISDYIYHAYYLKSTLTGVNFLATNDFLTFPNVRPRALKAGSEPNSRDTALAILYAFSRLLRNMLEPTADDDRYKREIRNSALAICRLCANLPIENPIETHLVERSLFWAGIILTESRFPSGQTPF